MRTAFLRLIGVALFVAILLKLDVRNILAHVAGVSPLFYTLACILTLVVILLKTWRWQAILASQGVRYSFRDAFLAYMATTYLGMLTPARLGEAAKVFYLKRDCGTSIGKGAASVFLDRLYDLAVLFIAGFAGIMAYALVSAASQAAFVLLVVVGAVVFFTRKSLVKALVKKTFSRFIPGEKKQAMVGALDEFYAALGRTRPLDIAWSMLLTVAAYAVLFLQGVLFAGLLGLDITYLFAMTNIAVSNIVNLLPVSIAAGIGTRDLVMVMLFRSQGLAESGAVAFSTLILGSLAFLTLVGLACWWLKPFSGRSGTQS